MRDAVLCRFVSFDRLAACRRHLERPSEDEVQATTEKTRAALDRSSLRGYRHTREEVRQRALMQQKLSEKEKAQKQENLRLLAQRAREERAGIPSCGPRDTYPSTDDSETTFSGAAGLPSAQAITRAHRSRGFRLELIK